ncbi:MAG: hypothetical protein JEZ06_23785 [Anaerolineaceae bacterium]|nr:hypothetical protein [Anaerolineaceae bacterium]
MPWITAERRKEFEMADPKYTLQIWNIRTNKKLNGAGVAFESKGGDIQIVLNPGVVMTESEDVKYLLTPTRE